ncbi:serine/threonine-protein kinase [Pedobacter hartonius]|uniref:Protein kinase domain-containing protein n=1 Tax=Pedobacter hartonius TaxID=425514 RepID=A0A1H4AZ74_9SPHI|nr:serine/threonine-protein kinase [Pedobacter hartonius]SEA41098.1 Protein kinase domain-containing protein [Pedobacter hartonius]
MSKVFTITEGLENMGALRTGGQGSVYKGRRFGPIITAVKLLPTPVHMENTEDKNFRSFQNEVEKLKKVNEEPNPNVVKILNSGITESGSFPFIEMEYIDGPDLEELLKEPHERIFTVKEVIKVADHLANALAHCHKVTVKHGDIKSNNVKFNIHTGNYVLLDFGLAAMSDEQRRTSIRHAGAIEFMAPEQSEGQMLFETDVYSYGVILYELLAGQVPFPLTDNGQKSRNEVLVGHLELAVPDILELRQRNIPESWSEAKKTHEMQVPGWLLTVIERCLEKLPQNRYADGIKLQESIVKNSIADAGNTGTAVRIADAPDTSLLQMENDRLQTLLRNYQDTAGGKADSGIVVISKPVFFVLIMGVVLMAAFLSYFLLFRNTDQKVRRSQPDRVVVPDTSGKSERKGYSWDREKERDTTDADTTGRAYYEGEARPVQLKPVPQPKPDTTAMDLDTTVHF